MDSFKKLCGYLFAVSAGLAAGVVATSATGLIGLLMLADPGATEGEIEAATVKCERFLQGHTRPDGRNVTEERREPR